MNTHKEYTLNDWNKEVEKSFNSKIQYFEKKMPYEMIIKNLKSKEFEEVGSWVLRHYFNKDLNKNDVWYCSDVNKDNVLSYIADSKNNFPHTLYETVMQNKINKDLRKTLNLLKDLDFVVAEDSPKNLKATSTLNEVALEVGGLSPTMINKITDKALQKFKRIYELMQNDDEAEFSKFYENLVDDIADCFATSFFEEETLEDAIARLLVNENIKSKDLNKLLPSDFVVLDNIFLNSKNVEYAKLKEMFVDDFWSTKRKNNLFQYSISRIINPGSKRGRKKNDKN